MAGEEKETMATSELEADRVLVRYLDIPLWTRTARVVDPVHDGVEDGVVGDAEAHEGDHDPEDLIHGIR